MSGVSKETRLQPITGWASGGCSLDDEHEISVVIGPHATASGLLSWGIGQIQQLNVLLDAITGSKNMGGLIEPAEICGSIRHQLQQVEAALDGAASLLLKQRETDSPA